MDRKESRCVSITHTGEKKQVNKQIDNTLETLAVPSYQIRQIKQIPSEYEQQHTLEIVVNKSWMEACVDRSTKNFQLWLSDLVKKTITTQESFFKRISYFIYILITFSKQKTFLLNWDIFQILSLGKLKTNSFTVLFKQKYKVESKLKSRFYRATYQQSLGQIKQIINGYYQLYKAEGILESYSDIENKYLENLKKAFKDLSQITKESHFLYQKSEISKILEDFMLASFRNQFVLIVTNILEILNRLHKDYRYFAEFLKQWLNIVSNKDQMKTIMLKIKFIHDKCIKMASQFESEEDFYKNPFQNRKKPKMPKSNSKQSTKDEQYDSSSGSRVSFMTKMYEYPKIYIKVYVPRSTITRMQWINQTYMKYIEVDRVDREQILKLQQQAKAKENQMNVLRYLSQLKRDYVFKFDITCDRYPETQQFQREDKAVDETTLCFQFRSRKADKDYATRVNEHFKKTITKEDLWAFRDRDLLYHFFLCFALSLSQLERHFIHHLDLSYDNFIKFYQIFEVIDFEHAYVVNKNNREFLKINRELFDLWLQSKLEHSLQFLVGSNQKFKQCKRLYLKGDIGKEQAIDKCINLMPQNMKKNHYERFSTLCRALLQLNSQNYEDFPLSESEIQKILQEIPENPPCLEGFYDQFAKRLKVIYQNYFPTKQIIGKSQYILQEDLKEITNQQISKRSLEKLVLLIENFKKQPLKYCFQYAQIRQYEEHKLVSSRRDHTFFDVNDLYDRQRNLVVFLLSVLLLLQELEKNGFLLLNLCLQLFVRSGEAFILKNFAYLFKIGPKHSEFSFLTRQDAQLSRISLVVLTKLLIVERSALRVRLFNNDVLDNIYEIAILNHNPYGSNSMPPLQRIRRFFVKDLRNIHFDQYKQLAQLLLAKAPKHFKNTEDLKGNINAKNLANFYTLIQDLKDMDILSSYQ